MRSISKRVVASLCLTVMTMALGVQTGPAFAKASSAGLDAIDALKDTIGEDGLVVGINDKTRRMYYAHQEGTNFYLAEYDLRPEVPKMLREEIMGVTNALGIGSFSPYTFQIDEKRDRMLILSYSTTRAGSAIKIIDLKTLKFSGAWDLAPIMPGFVGQGLTISDEDDRIYLIGSQAVNDYGKDTRGFQRPAQVSVAAAIAGDTPNDGTPERLWVRPVPQCQQVMDTIGVGALIARSQRLPALYFACIRAGQYPGESGLVRLWIDKDADQSAALDFPVDFYPVSGSFTIPTDGILGVAAFDPRRERFFMQSLSHGTPGVWIFDGKISSWVGFVVSPDNTNKFFGLDSASGHYYMAGHAATDKPGYVVVSDVSQTPVTQGLIVGGYAPRGFILVDERTHRLFMPVDLKPMGLYKGKEQNLLAMMVIRDNTKIADPQKPVDYDELTSNVKEGPGVVTNFSGGSNGFGSRTLLVGGYGGVVSATGQRPSLGSLRPGDRGLTAARVPSVDLRSGGASAAAQALVPDNNTSGDIYDTSQGNAPWPWGPATCLDGGGSPQDNEGEGPNGTATASCDLAKNKVGASASWSGVGADGLSIQASNFDARSWRDPADGVVTETVASARGIEVSVPGGGTLSIAKVWATARTVAHGRSGSAEADYERKITGIELTDAAGKVVQRIGECGGKKDVTCHDAIAEINKALPMKVNIKLPRPQVAGTPKGAFAGVFLREGDFIEARTMNNHGSTFSAEASSRAVPALQITIYNDSEEKSRLVSQLAAIEANSIYTNTVVTEQPIPKIDIPTPNTGIDAGSGGLASGPGITGGADLGLASMDTAAPAAPLDATPIAAQPLEGALAFLSRGPGSALLVGLVWMTFLSSGAAVFRRRSLLALLLEGMESK